jgi:lipopolysaccharide heptosyltransferase II
MNRLVILAPTWLGDAVLALPAVADVRRALPAADLVIAADRPAVGSLFGLVRGIDGVVALDRLRDGRFDAALLLPHSFRAALAAFRAGIPERWGYRSDWRGPLLTRAIRRPPRGHQAASYQHLVGALGFANGPGEPHLDLAGSIRAAGASRLERDGWNGRDTLVALAPGAAYGGAKRWPAASFARLARALGGESVRVVLVGGPAEAEVGREIVRALDRGAPVINTIGNDVVELAGVLANCRAIVSNDSGAMHLAAALGIRVTALFGPTDETKTRPLGDRHTVLTNPVWCRPCMLRECPIDHRCLRGIGVDTVVEAVGRALSASY